MNGLETLFLVGLGEQNPVPAPALSGEFSHYRSCRFLNPAL